VAAACAGRRSTTAVARCSRRAIRTGDRSRMADRRPRAALLCARSIDGAAVGASRTAWPRRSRAPCAAPSGDKGASSAHPRAADAHAGRADTADAGLAGSRVPSAGRSDRPRVCGRGADSRAKPSVLAPHASASVARATLHADGQAQRVDGRRTQRITGSCGLVEARSVCDDSVQAGARGSKNDLRFPNPESRIPSGDRFRTPSPEPRTPSRSRQWRFADSGTRCLHACEWSRASRCLLAAPSGNVPVLGARRATGGPTTPGIVTSGM
jgi:hypothetical protein